MELLEHQVTIWVQAVRTALHEIAIRHLIEMVQEIPTKMRSYSLFPRSSVSAFPARCTMRSPLARVSLLEDRLPSADRTQLRVILGDGGRV